MEKTSNRRPVIIGNWKMNVNRHLIDGILKLLSEQVSSSVQQYLDLFIAVPSPYYQYVEKRLPVGVNMIAQNCNQLTYGAFTGEISTDMLKDFDIQYVIVGHVERRYLFKEDNELIGAKIRHLQQAGLNVIACIDGGIDQSTVLDEICAVQMLSSELNTIIDNVSDWNRIIIAFDSFGATRKNQPLNAAKVQKIHSIIRSYISNHVSSSVGQAIRIIYGGSVSYSNCTFYIQQPDIDGFLIGSAALGVQFIPIINSVCY